MTFSIKSLGRSTGRDQDNGNNHTVKTNALSKNHDKDHTNEDGVSLGISSNTGVTGNTDSKSSGEGAESTAETSRKDFVSFTVVLPV
jgi:hypothetical protein